MRACDHVAFQVNDMDESVRFYVEKLGFKLSFREVNPEEGEEFAFLTLEELRLELIQDLKQEAYRKPEIRPPYCPHLALESEDLEATLTRLKSMGVPIVRGPLTIPGDETWLYCADPDNNILEYIQWFRKK